MTIYESRWKNAVRWAKRVNRALAEGHLVFVGEEMISVPLQIREDDIFGPFGDKTGSGIIWFINDTELDNGMHTEVDEWNRQHKVTCHAPVPLPEEV